jgi:hypothetical protein
MAFTKTFGTTAGSYATATLWKPISVRTPAYRWVASGSGTSEYYLELAGGGNPGFVAAPSAVYANGSAVTSGTPGSLAAARWGYGDNDTLGFSTIYIRLSDSTDPDSKTLDWVTFYQIPQAGEDVRFDLDSASITGGFDQSAVAIGAFVVEKGCSATFGSRSLGYLRINPTRFDFAGSGQAFIDLGSGSAIAPQVRTTPGGSNGEYGLYLRTTRTSDVLNIMGGRVAVAGLPGDLSTIATVRLVGAGELLLGNGCTATTLDIYQGSAIARCSLTTINQYGQGGKVFLEENAAVTTVNAKASNGQFYWNSTGNITTYNWFGGLFDMRGNGATRTLSTLARSAGTGVIHHVSAVTITTYTRSDPVSESISP